MKTKIVIATHGKFAEGILGSAELILGKQDNIEVINCYLDSEENYDSIFNEVVQKHDYQKENLLVITDLLGGSVNNEFLKYVGRPNFYLITGLNLPLLIELVSKINAEGETKTIIKRVLFETKGTIQLCNDLIDTEIEEENF